MHWSYRSVAVTAIILLAVTPAAHAQSPEHVAVVINDGSPQSRRIGEHYARVRRLPPSNVLRIHTSAEEAIEREAYVSTIERPLGLAITRAGLQDRLLYLMLTKGVPLRIAGTAGLGGTLASVDSELTLLYRRLTEKPVPVAGKIDNPYFLGTRDMSEARPFSHREHDIYLVTRLDAFTVDQALALVDRAQTPHREGRIVLDQRAAAAGSRSGDEWLERAARRLAEQGHERRMLLETTSKPARDVDPVLGYYSWGAMDPENRVRSTGLRFAPGSIAANLAGFDARTFRQPPDEWTPTTSTDHAEWFEGSGDSLIGDLIRDGVTGVSGQVGEAYVLGAVRPEILFSAYLAGFNLAEAFYLAIPTLSWQTVVVGDPLCAPFAHSLRARRDVEDSTDPATGLPALFAKRRVAAIAAANRDVPEAAIAPVVRAIALIENDDKAGATRALADAVKLAPRLPDWLVVVATLQEQAGDHEAAIINYEGVLRIQPTHVVALNNLAYALAVRRGAPADARPLAKRAAALAPQAGTVLDTYAWIEHLLGNDAEAARLLAEAVRLEPAQAEIRLHAAFVAAAMGDRAHAERELKEALRLDAAIGEREDVRRLRVQIER